MASSFSKGAKSPGQQVLSCELLRDRILKHLNPWKLSDLQRILEFRCFKGVMSDEDLKHCFKTLWGCSMGLFSDSSPVFTLEGWQSMSFEQMRDTLEGCLYRQLHPGCVDVTPMKTKEDILEAFGAMAYVPRGIYATAASALTLLRELETKGVDALDEEKCCDHISWACTAGLSPRVIFSLADRYPSFPKSLLAELAGRGGHSELIDSMVERFGRSCSIQECALSSAVQHGHTDAVRHLLDTYGMPDFTEYTDHVRAAANGLMDVVRLLVERGANVNAQYDGAYEPLLDYVARKGDVDLARLLIERGANIHVRSGINGDESILRSAACHGDADMVLLLLEHGADATDAGATDPALNCAIERGHIDVARILIDRGADPHAKGEFGETPLHGAAKGRHCEAVRFLVDEYGVDVHALGCSYPSDGANALHVACDWGGAGDIEMIRMLADEYHVDVHARKKNGESVLHCAANSGYADVTRLFIDVYGVDVNAKHEDGRTPLHHAVWYGRVDVVRALVERGADVDAKDQEGRTPLHRASDGSKWDSGRADVVRVLVEHGADVDARAGDGRTPLHYATCQGHADVVRVLVERGADVDAKDEDGLTALQRAALSSNSDVFRFLAEHRGDVTDATDATDAIGAGEGPARGRGGGIRIFCDEDGMHLQVLADRGPTALHNAASSGHVDMARVLIDELGADVCAQDIRGRTVLHRAAENGHIDILRYLIDEHGADVHAKDDDGQTATHTAAGNGHIDILRYLVDEHGVDVHAKDDDGQTATHRASRNGHIDILRYLVDEHGVDVHARDRDGKTALHHAVCDGRMDVARYLVDEHGADVHAEDVDGRTVLDVAEKAGNLYLMQPYV